MNLPGLNIVLLLALLVGVVRAAPAESLRAGVAEREITPQVPVPLWGYTGMNRPDNLSTGTLDPLMARALVLDFGGKRVAFVSLDLGRAPNEPMVDRIRARVAQEAGIGDVLFVGSHTHHAPALEVDTVDPEALPEDFRGLAEYYPVLEAKLTEVLLQAAEELAPARWGHASAESALNRNRHTEEAPIPRDPELFVLRIDHADGRPMGLLVNFAAHPTVHPPQNNQFSADYVGVMTRAVQAALGVPCLFLQGAAGDLQCEMNDDLWGKEDFIEPIGAALAQEVIAINAGIETAAPASLEVKTLNESLDFGTRKEVDLTDEKVLKQLRIIYTPPLANSYIAKYAGNRVHPRMSVWVLADSLAIVSGSGEFFSDFSVQLKQKAPLKTIFAGYCNGHDLYFPTWRAASQGGYGAQPPASFVEVGAGEAFIARALFHLREMTEE